MKKLVTLILVLAGIVGTASAQRQTANTIRVGFSDTENCFTEDHFYIFVFGSSNDDSWPGVDVTANVETIDGVTYHYRDFPIDTYGTGFSVIVVNDNGSSHENQKQTVDINWSYNASSEQKIQKDTYFNIGALKDNKYEVSLVPMYYVTDTDAAHFVKATKSGNNYSATINVSDFRYFVIANSWAFKADGSINWEDNNGYPANIYRPNWDKSVEFVNQEHSTETEYWEFKRYFEKGCWDASELASDVKIEIGFTIDNYDAVSCSLSPYFTRTINASAGYATFSSAYNVAIPDGVDAYWGKEVTDGKIVMKKYTKGIPASVGALLSGSGEVTFTPATETDKVTAGSNLLKASVTDTELTGSSTSPYYYILGGTSAETVGFYYVNTTRNSGAGKAYLATTTELATENANARAAWIFDEEGETTGIAAVKASQKMNGEFFNLAGQRVAQPTKGLYIVNGKKVIMK